MVLELIFVAVVAFIGGAIYGDLQKATVDNAIASLKKAEAAAQATIDKITKHKAS